MFAYVGKAAFEHANTSSPYDRIGCSRLWALAGEVVLRPKGWMEVVAAVPPIDYIALPAALIGLLAGASMGLVGGGRLSMRVYWAGCVILGVLSLGFGTLGIMAFVTDGWRMFWICEWTDGDNLVDQNVGFLGRATLCCVAALVLARAASRARKEAMRQDQ